MHNDIVVSPGKIIIPNKISESIGVKYRVNTSAALTFLLVFILILLAFIQPQFSFVVFFAFAVGIFKINSKWKKKALEILVHEFTKEKILQIAQMATKNHEFTLNNIKYIVEPTEKQTKKHTTIYALLLTAFILSYILKAYIAFIPLTILMLAPKILRKHNVNYSRLIKNVRRILHRYKEALQIFFTLIHH
ncbi:MAG: hypothetical protein ACP5IZ_11250 [Thermoprotei archaeon]